MDIHVDVIHSNGVQLTCDCCGKRNMRKLYSIEADEIEPVKLGATCIHKHFGVSMTGNPFDAYRRLVRHINSLRFSKLEQILEEVGLKEVDS